MSRTTRRVWLGAVYLCWFVTLVLLIRHPRVDALPGESAKCPERLFEHALSPSDFPCEVAARERLHTLTVWVVLTAPVTLGYVAARRRTDEAE